MQFTHLMVIFIFLSQVINMVLSEIGALSKLGDSLIVVTYGQLLAQITIPAGWHHKKAAPSLGAKTMIWSPSMNSIVN